MKTKYTIEEIESCLKKVFKYKGTDDFVRNWLDYREVYLLLKRKLETLTK